MSRVALGDGKDVKNSQLKLKQIKDTFNNVFAINYDGRTCKRGIAMVMMACMSGREGLSSVCLWECAIG